MQVIIFITKLQNWKKCSTDEVLLSTLNLEHNNNNDNIDNYNNESNDYNKMITKITVTITTTILLPLTPRTSVRIKNNAAIITFKKHYEHSPSSLTIYYPYLPEAITSNH